MNDYSRRTREMHEEYWQTRCEDLLDTLMDLVQITSEIVSQVRTELEILRAERRKESVQ